MRLPSSDHPISDTALPVHSSFEDRGASTFVMPGRKDVRGLRFSVWEKDYEGYLRHVDQAVQNAEFIWVKEDEGNNPALVTEVELLPRPDNSYDPRAVSIVDVSDYGSPVHMGYLFSDDVSSLSNAIRGFRHWTNKPLRCLMLTRFYESKKAEFPFNRDPEIRNRFRLLGYVPSGSSLVLPRRRPMIDAMGAHLREAYGSLLAPADELRLSLDRDSLDLMRRAHRDRLFELDFIAQGESIEVAAGSRHLTSLDARKERFFKRTFDQIVEIGKPVRVLAQCRTKNIVVFVENRVPLEDLPGREGWTELVHGR